MIVSATAPTMEVILDGVRTTRYVIHQLQCEKDEVMYIRDIPFLSPSEIVDWDMEGNCHITTIRAQPFQPITAPPYPYIWPNESSSWVLNDLLMEGYDLDDAE